MALWVRTYVSKLDKISLICAKIRKIDRNMNAHQDQYKKMTKTDTNLKHLERVEQLEERRKFDRTTNFLRNRDVSESPRRQTTQEKKMTDPEVRLRRWKMEKAMRKKLENKNKKPVFKVGVVHHKFYSPVSYDKIKKHTPCHTRKVYKIKAPPSPPKRVTRATQKRLEAKKASAMSSPLTTTMEFSDRPSTSASATRRKSERTPSKKHSNKSFAPTNYEFHGPSGVVEIPIFGRFRGSKISPRAGLTETEEFRRAMEMPWPTTYESSQMDSSPLLPKKLGNKLVRQNAVEDVEPAIKKEPPEEDTVEETMQTDCLSEVPDREITEENSTVDPDTPASLDTPDSPTLAIISPYVTVSRGKNSARRENRTKIGINRTPEEIPTKENVMQNLNISVEEEERTAQYFKFILQREIDRLRELCSLWEQIKSDPDVTEDASYQINQAIGQTNLLIAKKFARFRSLVNDCETGKGEMLVQCRDLQGFWDMTYMEVKDVDARFQKLESLRSKNWVEDEIVVEKKKQVRKKAAPKLNARGKSSSSVRSWILAKKKIMSEDKQENFIHVRTQSEQDSSVKNKIQEKTPTEKDHARRSMRQSMTVPQMPNRASLNSSYRKTPSSLLKKVQISQCIRSPLAVMKISRLCKTPEVQHDDTITYINSDQTPAKSILKKFNDSSNFDSTIRKSTRKVDFRDDVINNENEIDENLENSIDLGRALARIDSYNSDASDDESERISEINAPLPVGKKLDFEDEVFDEVSNIEKSPVKSNSILPTIFVTDPTPRKRFRKSLNTSREDNISDTPDSQMRVLRNRVITGGTSNKNTRRSTQRRSGPQALNLDSSTKENQDSHTENFDTSKSTIIDVDSKKSDVTNRRRSTRKSVRLNADDCTACIESVCTPGRGGKVSLFGNIAQESVIPLSNGDLMSFETPPVSTKQPRRSTTGKKRSKK